MKGPNSSDMIVASQDVRVARAGQAYGAALSDCEAQAFEVAPRSFATYTGESIWRTKIASATSS